MLENANCRSFGEGAILIDELFEVTVIAEFRDDVRVIGSVEDVKQS